MQPLAMTTNLAFELFTHPTELEVKIHEEGRHGYRITVSRTVDTFAEVVINRLVTGLRYHEAVDQVDRYLRVLDTVVVQNAKRPGSQLRNFVSADGVPLEAKVLSKELAKRILEKLRKERFVRVKDLM